MQWVGRRVLQLCSCGRLPRADRRYGGTCEGGWGTTNLKMDQTADSCKSIERPGSSRWPRAVADVSLDVRGPLEVVTRNEGDGRHANWCKAVLGKGQVQVLLADLKR